VPLRPRFSIFEVFDLEADDLAFSLFSYFHFTSQIGPTQEAGKDFAFSL